MVACAQRCGSKKEIFVMKLLPIVVFLLLSFGAAKAQENWTGSYLGFGGSSIRTINGTTITINPEIEMSAVTRAVGGLGYGRIGYDVQTTGFVAGVFLDLGFGTLAASANNVVEYRSGATDITLSQGVREQRDRFATLGVRIGTTIQRGNTLMYGRLGISKARVRANVSYSYRSTSAPGSSGSNVGLSYSDSGKKSIFAPMIGVGFEHRLNRAISLFTEFNYHAFNSTFSFNNTGVNRAESSFNNIGLNRAETVVRVRPLQTMTVGVNYRF
jgi:hypothetical protein